MQLNLFMPKSKKDKSRSRSLRQHRLKGKNEEYEFAAGVLDLLQKIQHLYTTPTDTPSPRAEP